METEQIKIAAFSHFGIFALVVRLILDTKGKDKQQTKRF